MWSRQPGLQKLCSTLKYKIPCGCGESSQIDGLKAGKITFKNYHLIWWAKVGFTNFLTTNKVSFTLKKVHFVRSKNCSFIKDVFIQNPELKKGINFYWILLYSKESIHWCCKSLSWILNIILSGQKFGKPFYQVRSENTFWVALVFNSRLRLKTLTVYPLMGFHFCHTESYQTKGCL